MEKQKIFGFALLFLHFTLYLLLPSTLLYAAFTDTGAGARAPGMGNAFTAIADDVYSIYYNPAGLALLSRPELVTSYTQHLIGLFDNASLGTSFIGYAHPLSKNEGTIGLSWQMFNLNSGFYQEQSFGISYGHFLLKNFGLGNLYGGINLKNLSRSFATMTEADNAYNGLERTGLPDPVLSRRSSLNALDIDVGFLYRLHKHYSAGLSIMHLIKPDMAFSLTDSDFLPINIKFGINYRNVLSNMAFQYETRKSPIQKQDHRVTIGAERWLPWLQVGNLGARASLSIGSRDFKQITAGISYQSRHFAIDYGFIMPFNTIVSIAGTHRLNFSIRFGEIKEGLAPKLEYQKEGLSDSQRTLMESYLAEVMSLETSAKYEEALSVLNKARALNPQDPKIMKSFNRLNFITAMIKNLPDYQTEPVQSTLHQGILAYLSYNDAEAIDKVSDALGLAPDSKEIDSFLTKLELAVGLKRNRIAQLQEVSGAEIQNLYNQGLYFYNSGQLEKAKIIFERIQKIDSSHEQSSKVLKRIKEEMK